MGTSAARVPLTRPRRLVIKYACARAAHEALYTPEGTVPQLMTPCGLGSSRVTFHGASALMSVLASGSTCLSVVGGGGGGGGSVQVSGCGSAWLWFVVVCCVLVCDWELGWLIVMLVLLT